MGYMEQLQFWDKTPEEKTKDEITQIKEKINKLRRSFFVRQDYTLNALSKLEEDLVNLQEKMGITEKRESKIVELPMGCVGE